MKVEIRNNQVTLDGYVNVVSRDSRALPSPRGQFIEQIVPKTFERALDRATDVDILFNHNKDRKLGSITQGNLELYEDQIGLRAVATITDEEVIEKAKNGDLKGWSFGFINNRDTWEVKDGVQRRYVEDLDLLEVSVLSVQPAYIATSLEMRGEQVAVHEQRNFEDNIEVKTDLDTNLEMNPETNPDNNSEMNVETNLDSNVEVKDEVNVDIDVKDDVEEERQEPLNYGVYEAQIEILKLRGGKQ
jgi:uncharacterized protein